jgi:hypothetical protein
VAAFTPPALPGFLVIPAAIPWPPVLLPLSISLLWGILGVVQFATKTGGPAWFVQIHIVLLDAVCDPGVGAITCH